MKIWKLLSHIYQSLVKQYDDQKFGQTNSLVWPRAEATLVIFPNNNLQWARWPVKNLCNLYCKGVLIFFWCIWKDLNISIHHCWALYHTYRLAHKILLHYQLLYYLPLYSESLQSLCDIITVTLTYFWIAPVALTYFWIVLVTLTLNLLLNEEKLINHWKQNHASIKVTITIEFWFIFQKFKNINI
jgi:hypothetical protein